MITYKEVVVIIVFGSLCLLAGNINLLKVVVDWYTH